jgi:hypothetical protein
VVVLAVPTAELGTDGGQPLEDAKQAHGRVDEPSTDAS